MEKVLDHLKLLTTFPVFLGLPFQVSPGLVNDTGVRCPLFTAGFQLRFLPYHDGLKAPFFTKLRIISLLLEPSDLIHYIHK